MTTQRPNRYAGASSKTLADTLVRRWYVPKLDDEDEELLEQLAREEEEKDYDSVEDYEDVLNDLGTFSTSRDLGDE